METNEEQTNANNRVPEVVVRPLGRVLFMLERSVLTPGA